LLNANGGDDLVNVKSLGRPAIVNGGAGNDTVVAGYLVNKVDALGAPLAVNGGTGKDELDVMDTAVAAGQTYVVSANSLLRSGAGGFFFNDSLEQLNVAMGDFDDQVTVQAKPSVGTLALFGHGGKNQLTGPDADTFWKVTGPDIGTLGTNVRFE